MFFKKKKQEPVNSNEETDNKNVLKEEKKYSSSGNFPHILLSYILIFFLGLLILQSFSLNSKFSGQTDKLYKYVSFQEERLQKLEKETEVPGSKEDEKENEDTVINNYYYGQSPYSQHQPGAQTNLD